MSHIDQAGSRSGARRRVGHRLAFAAVMSVAAFLRFVRLDNLPPALFRDEAEKAMNAWSLMEGGVDLEGRPWPLFIHVYGVTTSAIYQYAAAAVMAVAGPTTWAARAPAALVSLATVALVYHVAARWRGRRTALWAAAFLAFSPWHVTFGRWAQQGVFLPLCAAAAGAGLLAFDRRRLWGLPLAGAAAGIACYAYDPARAYVPLVGLWAVWLWRRELMTRPRAAATGLIVAAVSITPTALLLLTQNAAAQARFSRVSIFGDSPSLMAAAGRFLSNYAAHLSPRFLLLRGDSEPRHGAGVGVLTWTEATCLLAGIVTLATARRPALVSGGWAPSGPTATRRRFGLWLLGCLAAFPMAASLTREGIPHALRCIVALPTTAIIAGAGAAALVAAVRSRFGPRRAGEARWALALAAVAGFLPFASSYYGPYARWSARSWQHGVEDAVNLAMDPRGGITPAAPVVFAYVDGAEHLVPWYAGLAPSELRAHALTRTRWRVVAGAVVPAELSSTPGPVAFVVPADFPIPPDFRVIPIAGPGVTGSRRPGAATMNIAVKPAK